MDSKGKAGAESVRPRKRNALAIGRLVGLVTSATGALPRALQEGIVSKRGAGNSFGFRFLWIHPFGWLKSNIQTILVPPDSGRLRFPLKIWVRAGGVGSPASQQAPPASEPS